MAKPYFHYKFTTISASMGGLPIFASKTWEKDETEEKTPTNWALVWKMTIFAVLMNIKLTNYGKDKARFSNCLR